MTQDELNALAELLNRAPLTRAERLWVISLFERLSTPAKDRGEEADG